MTPPLRSVRAFLAIGLALACSGCVSLDTASDLGKVADQLRSTLPPVTADIPASCQRFDAFITDTPDNERGGLTTNDCKPYNDLADRVTADQAVLIAYLDALAKLASNAPMGFEKTTESNASTAGSYSGLSSNASIAASAAQKIIGALADAATQHYRQQQVTKLITTADPSIQELTAALKRVIAVDYVKILNNEQAGLKTFYEGPIAARRGERLSLILVQRQYAGDGLVLNRRLAAAAAYGQVMDDIGTTHARLVSATAGHSGKELAKQLDADLTTLKTAIAGLAAQEK